MRSSRRLAAVAVMALTLAGSSGCSPELACDSGWCGTIVVSARGAQSLFPPRPQPLDVDLGIADLLFSRLAEVGPSFNTIGDADFVGDLASSWAFEDNLTISFSLNPQARWHDGLPVTAEDVVFTHDVYQDPVVNSSVRPRLGAIESVTARDSLTAVFRFRRHYPEQFFDAVAWMHILPSHLLETVAPEDLRTHEYALHPIGSGPYRLVSWTPGEVAELAADSNHFLGRPGVPRIIWAPVLQPAEAVNELLADQADFVYYVPQPSDMERVRQAPHLRLVEYPSNTYNFIGFNLRDPADGTRPHPLFGDRAFRRAIVMAVNRPALRQAVLGENTLPSVGPVTPALSIWDANLHEGIPFDSAGARAALDSLGWSDSDGDGILDRDGQLLEFELLVPSIAVREQGALVLQDQLRRSGIQMNIVTIDFTAFFDRAVNGEFDAQYSSLAQDPSPAAMASDWTEDGFAAFNWGKYSNPEFTRLAREARDEFDREASLAKWHAALRIINEDAPAIWLYIPRKFAAVHVRLENVSIFPFQPWIGLPEFRVEPSQLIERDLYGTN